LLALVAAGMLFYIYLFGIKQTQSRQAAWFKSFVIWICLEIVVVSSVCVLVQHIAIPMVTMSDVRKVKDKVVRDILSYNSKVRKGRIERSADGDHSTFNAAAFLYPSFKLAAMNRDLRESAVITHYNTIYPKKAFVDEKSNNVKKSYDTRFTFITQAFSRVAVFAITSLIQLPPPLQDAVTDVISTFGFGYAFVLIMRLWRISPALAFSPFAFLVLIVHFLTMSGKANTRPELSKTFPVEDDEPVDLTPAPVGSDSSDAAVPASLVLARRTMIAAHPPPPPTTTTTTTAGSNWKSRRASAVESMSLAEGIARRIEGTHDAPDDEEEGSDQSGSLQTRQARPVPLLARNSRVIDSSPSEDSEDANSSGGQGEIEWEEGGSDFDPDTPFNHLAYLLPASDSSDSN
jgi:hypothetical protein